MHYGHNRVLSALWSNKKTRKLLFPDLSEKCAWQTKPNIRSNLSITLLPLITRKWRSSSVLSKGALFFVSYAGHGWLCNPVTNSCSCTCASGLYFPHPMGTFGLRCTTFEELVLPPVVKKNGKLLQDLLHDITSSCSQFLACKSTSLEY